MRELLKLNVPCDETLAWMTIALDEAGLGVQWGFDLRSAMAGVGGCACPHHGYAHCDCQYMVVLVSGHDAAPASLVLHGRGRQCWIMLGTDRPVEPRLEAAIANALRFESAAIV